MAGDKIHPLIVEKVLENVMTGYDCGDTLGICLDYRDYTEWLMISVCARREGLHWKPCLQVAVPPQHYADSTDNVMQDFGS